MILVDVNLLVYAHVESLPQHERARAWLDEQLSGATPVGLPWQSLLGFLRLVTNPRLFQKAHPTSAAWDIVHAWINCDAVWIPQPTERHSELLGQLLENLPGIQANLIPDAHLAALAIEHGLLLCSSDGDFARFPNLRWLNPLAK